MHAAVTPAGAQHNLDCGQVQGRRKQQEVRNGENIIININRVRSSMYFFIILSIYSWFKHSGHKVVEFTQNDGLLWEDCDIYMHDISVTRYTHVVAVLNWWQVLTYCPWVFKQCRISSVNNKPKICLKGHWRYLCVSRYCRDQLANCYIVTRKQLPTSEPPRQEWRIL